MRKMPFFAPAALIFLLAAPFAVSSVPSQIRPYLFLPRTKADINGGIQTVDPQMVQAYATDLLIPWDIAFPSKDEMLVTERPGTLFYRSPTGDIRIPIEETVKNHEGGLLGIALHPDFKENRWIYLYNTVEQGGKNHNRVERYRFEDGALSHRTIIIDNIPGATYHDGGRIAFGPDGCLYITTGDAAKEHLSQDKSSLAGKILRVKDDGSIPADNPFKSPVWSYGHRNPQGITWDSQGNLWSTEHGPSDLQTGYDELNLIVKGENYGWPLIIGDEKQPGMQTPKLHSGGDNTWAPASALFWDGSVFFGGLRGQAIYEANITKKPIELKAHFKETFGRIRTIVLGPDGNFYVTTSNTDGRGFPQKGDDKILKINPRIFREKPSSDVKMLFSQ